MCVSTLLLVQASEEQSHQTGIPSVFVEQPEFESTLQAGESFSVVVKINNFAFVSLNDNTSEDLHNYTGHYQLELSNEKYTWKSDELFSDHATIELPQDFPPGRYSMKAILHNNEHQPITASIARPVTVIQAN